MPRARRHDKQGFTLLEIVVWIFVASLVATTGYLVLAPWAQERKLHAGTERVVAALEYGREVARHEGRHVRVRIATAQGGPGANSVHITYADDGTDVVHPLTHSSFVLDFQNDPPLQGIQVLASSADGGDTVEFDERGEPVQLTTQFTLQCAGARSVVRVEPYSGRVTIDTPLDPAQPPNHEPPTPAGG